MKKGFFAFIIASLLSSTGMAMAKSPDSPKVFGWVEKSTLMPWGVELKTKLDSGALTSSLHATDVEVFEKDGEDWVRFTVDVVDEATGKKVEKHFEKPRYRKVLIRGAGGTERRPVVLMKVCMGNTVYEEQFTLNDRSDMIYPILLGRRTISHLGYLDVTQTFQHSPQCDKNSPVKMDKDQKDDEDIDD